VDLNAAGFAIMPADEPNRPGQDGFAWHQSILVQPEFAAFLSQMEARYPMLEAAQKAGGAVAANRLLAPGQRFVPTASSLSIGAVLSDKQLRAIFAAIRAGPAGAWITDQLGNRIACDLDQAWVRRQFAPGNYPPLHAPHGWHQDGALRFDYFSHPDGIFPPDALLSMVTCWIALTPCGVDAPGLEIVTRRLDGLLAPTDLVEDRVRARFAAGEFWRPILAPGDALLFRGDLLHRTHVTPAMTRDRTSIELRFFPADRCPARLQDDRFIPLL
jgi:hypothetical protein